MIFQRKLVYLILLPVIGIASTIGLTFSADAEPSTSELVSFDETRFPEGLAVAADGTIYVGIANTGEILEVSPSGDYEVLAHIALPEDGLLLGLTVHAGSVYGLVTAGPESAVYVISRDSGNAHKLATLPADSFPNSLVFGDRGEIYVADTVGGRILEVQRFGIVETWVASPLLQGNVANPGPLGIPIGANGIAYSPERDAFYVAVTEGGRVVEVAINADGTAGDVSTLSETSSLIGADGIAVAQDGTIFVTSFLQNTILSVEPASGRTEIVLSGDSYHAPASVAFSPDQTTIYVTNFDGLVLFGLADGPPMTSLLSVDASGLEGDKDAITPPSTGSAGLAK